MDDADSAIDSVSTYRGEVAADRLGATLMHEHVFVRDPELERDLVALEWDASNAVERAVRGLTDLAELGIGAIVDLTVPGLGRDVALVNAVAERVPIDIIAATGFYTADVLPLYFRARGPGRLVEGPDPLVELFVRDLTLGISGSGVRAGMIKVMSGAAGVTGDVAAVMSAAAIAHQQTGVTITTHSEPGLRNGLEQQAYLVERGVAPTRIIVGHAGDSADLAYLRAIMDRGSTIGIDRFGMEHMQSDERRVDTVVGLVEMGYADRIVLSQDAAFYSHVTPPSWRAAHAPRWEIQHLSRRVLPVLRRRGVSSADLERMLVQNPRMLLARTHVV